MQDMLIQGGARLVGTVPAAGSKNAALPILFATLLAPGVHRIRRVPKLADIRTTFGLLNGVGAVAQREDDGTVVIDTTGVNRLVAPYDLVRTMRASIVMLGPLVARYGEAQVSLPGGCAIGARPIDLHLKALEALGATMTLEHGYVYAKAPAGGLVGATVAFDKVTVGGTENLMMAATLARGETLIENAAREPEIVDLAQALIGMGAHIEGHGTAEIRVRGVSALKPMDHTVIADRVEVGTLLAAGAATGGDVTVTGAAPGDLEAVLAKFREMGCTVTVTREGGGPHGASGAIRLVAPERVSPVRIATSPHPGFPTDMQAQAMAVLLRATGTSILVENIFENRFMHVLELLRMGAKIRTEGHTAVVEGVEKLSGAPVMATDLRASASLIIAGLVAEGTTLVGRIYHLDRGYDGLEAKLRTLGARIERRASGSVVPEALKGVES